MVDMARNYNVAVFTASQLSKEMGNIYSTEEVQQKDVSGSKEKINKCDIGLAFKPVSTREGNVQKGIWSWLKTRRGQLPESFFGAIDYDKLQPIYIKPYARQEDVPVMGENNPVPTQKKPTEKVKSMKSITFESGE